MTTFVNYVDYLDVPTGRFDVSRGDPIRGLSDLPSATSVNYIDINAYYQPNGTPT
jgi:hypothetical protein